MMILGIEFGLISLWGFFYDRVDVGLVLWDHFEVGLVLVLQFPELFSQTNYGFIQLVDFNFPGIEIGTETKPLLLKHLQLILQKHFLFL